MRAAADVTSAETTTIVGIDEAGYGPILGPLVASAVAFDVPVPVMAALKDPAGGPDLWKLLSAAVTPRATQRTSRLAVADSKKLYNGCNSARGLVLLERAALAFFRQAFEPPASLRELLTRVCPPVCEQLETYPWYRGGDVELPVECHPDDVGTQGNALAAVLRSKGVRLRGVWVEVLPEGHFNERVRATRNKSVVLFSLVTRLLARVAEGLGGRPMRAWIDRQGGRVSYGPALMTAFDDARLEIIEETPRRSSYRLDRPSGPWLVRFVEKGETLHLPIALASVFSKYVRELCMICFNRYWAGHVAGLKPTGGYHGDGRRFLADIAPVLDAQRHDRDRLVRRV
ncbi:MAG: hypothetical protein HRF43_08595 [Phycisphaerae bacterium]|jgi:hypothetical protein